MQMGQKINKKFPLLGITSFLLIPIGYIITSISFKLYFDVTFLYALQFVWVAGFLEFNVTNIIFFMMPLFYAIGSFVKRENYKIFAILGIILMLLSMSLNLLSLYMLGAGVKLEDIESSPNPITMESTIKPYKKYEFETYIY